MTDEQPTPWVHGFGEDRVAYIAHALRHEGKQGERVVIAVANTSHGWFYSCGSQPFSV